MHAAKTITITGSIERWSTPGIQRWQDDHTKAYVVRIWPQRSPIIPAIAWVQPKSLIIRRGWLSFASIVNISQSLRGTGTALVACLMEIKRSRA